MKTKKTLSILLCLFIFLMPVIFSVQVSANQISPAIGIIKNSTELKKNALLNTDIIFTAEEFEKILGIKKIESITIKSLPDVNTGVLVIGNQDVAAGQTITRENLKYLRVIPYPDRLGSIEFTFQNTADTDEISLKCRIAVLDSLKFSPTASPADISTQKNTAVFKTMKAVDIDGCDLTYKIARIPKNGKVIITDRETGNFIYIPNANYTGKDNFMYYAEDEYGNVSNTATISVKVTKPAANTNFSDLHNHWAANSAIKAVAAGIIENDNLFNPETIITRAEFIKMALIAAKLDKDLSKTYTTVFEDDLDIPLNLKAYVQKAYELGIINGIQTDYGLYFDPNNVITRSEAAVVINKILKVPTANIVSTGASPEFIDAIAIPGWAADDIAALYRCGILNGTGNGGINPYGVVDKAQAVEMLCNMSDYNKTKTKSGGFLSFIFG